MTPAQEFAQLQRLQPADAIAFLARKAGTAQTYGWADMWQDEHTRQFTVSRLASADLLETLRSAIVASVAGDLSRRDFMRDARAALAQAGWWGEKEVTDPATGEILKTRFDPARLKLIFDTNTRQAYAAGQWERVQRSKATHPYLRYITKGDDRVRPAHAAWNNVTLPVDDVFWLTHYPPNGWRCRCRVVAVSQREYDSGTTPTGAVMDKAQPDVVWRQWQNQRSGVIETVPTGVDPGFGFNPGLARAREQQAVVRDKLLSIDARTGAELWNVLPDAFKVEQLREWQSQIQRAADVRQASNNALLVHVVSSEVQDALQAQGIYLDSAAVLMRDSELQHAMRDSKAARGAAIPDATWAQLPQLLESAAAWLDSANTALVYSVEQGDGQVAKVVVRMNYGQKARFDRERVRVTANFVQTGGMVSASNMSVGTQYVPLNAKAKG